MFSAEEKKEILDYLDKTEGDIAIGCDSVRQKKKGKWVSLYSVTLCVHINNMNGWKIFYYKELEDDYDIAKKPRMRLMNEVMKAVECYLEFEDVFLEQDRHVEMHLDLNPNRDHESSAVVGQAKGYVIGLTGIEPFLKPEAFSASYAADHVARGKPM